MTTHLIKSARITFFASLIVAGFVAAPAVHAQVIDIASKGSDPISHAPMVRLIGFTPGVEVEVSYTRTAPDGVPPAFRASSLYRVGPDGTVDVASVPLRGDWKSPLPEAPFWAMHADEGAAVPAPGLVLIQAKSSGTLVQVEHPLSESAIPTKSEPVQEFAGAFLVRPADASGPLPLIIVLGGSEGDDTTARGVSPQLAAEGYAVLGLPYRSPDRGQGQAIPGLPSLFSEIPVDRLETVHQWATGDARIDPERIGLWGFSKGAEFAIIAASRFPWLDAVAAIAPSDVVWEGFGSGSVERTGTSSFSFNGQPLPFVAYGGTGRGRDTKQLGRRQSPERAAAARIPIEDYQGLLLVAGGERDQTTDSAGMSQAMAERRAEHGRQTVQLIFEDAGHALGAAGGRLDPIESEQGDPNDGTGIARKLVWAATLELFRTAWPEPGDR